jgi:hypothetical protein
VKHVPGSPLEGRLLALPTNIRLGWKGPSGIHTLSYYNLRSFVKYGHKSFITSTPDRAQRHFRRKIRHKNVIVDGEGRPCQRRQSFGGRRDEAGPENSPEEYGLGDGRPGVREPGVSAIKLFNSSSLKCLSPPSLV